uniref:Fungal-type protein kinase domain-containing protein n=1 Tax=Ganoderma boninense TaxID=34458 RepID=A0A5K1JWN5_9APHY|nr:Uncharacterized protein [Ganoderma boninense]
MASGVIHLEHDVFYHQFLPCPNHASRLKRTRSNPFKALTNADKMTPIELSDTFLKTVNTQGLIPGLLIRDTKTAGKGTDDKHNVAIFQDVQNRGSFSWADQAIPVEFVQPGATGADPFNFTEPGCEDGEVKDVQDLSFKQLSTTVELLFMAQHRVAVFMLFVIGRKFRLMRWDRAGIVVTPAVDYFEDHATLCDVLSRISHLDSSALGFDLSATRVLPGTAEFSQMESAAQKNSGDVDHSERDLGADEIGELVVFEYVRSLFCASLTDDSDWPWHRLEVPSGATVRHYLVGKPTFCAAGVAGRGTRGYVALDCQTGRFVWLKDVWRMSYMGMDREGDVLQRLNSAGIEGVPTLVCHGDVLEQVTATSIWSSSTSTSHHGTPPPGPSPALQPNPEASFRGPLRQHRHYRIAVEEVCLPLDYLMNGKQLVSLMLDALRAHYQASVNPHTRLLHCDVSSGNIMIHPKIKRDGTGRATSLVWTGILSDWELSKSVDAEQACSTATQIHRLGTYQFMSVNLLQGPARPVQISDELESFFHVLVYYAVRRLRSTCDRPCSWITDYFHRYGGPLRLGACGLKSTAVETRGRLESFTPPGPLFFFSPLDELISTALRAFRAHYKVMEHERLQDCAPPPPFPPRRPMDPARKRLRQRNYHIDEEVRALLDAEHATRKPVDHRPTAEDRELSASLADHAFMIAHLEKFLCDPRWADDDRIPPPQPPSPSLPSPPAELQEETAALPRSTEMGKRACPAESSSHQDRAAKRPRTSRPRQLHKASAPVRPSTHAMRTRSQTQRDRAILGVQLR